MSSDSLRIVVHCCSFVDLSAVCHVYSRALQLSRFHPFSPPIRRIIIDFPCEKKKEEFGITCLAPALPIGSAALLFILTHWGWFIYDVHCLLDFTFFMIKSFCLLRDYFLDLLERKIVQAHHVSYSSACVGMVNIPKWHGGGRKRQNEGRQRQRRQQEKEERKATVWRVEIAVTYTISLGGVWGVRFGMWGMVVYCGVDGLSDNCLVEPYFEWLLFR